MKVVFIVTDSFLRTAEKTDPFYDPLMRAADAAGIEWTAFTSGEECGYPPEKTRSWRSFRTAGVWFYRMCRIAMPWLGVEAAYRLFGRLARPFFAKRFAADLIVTQAGMFASCFETMLPETRTADVQHGIIYSRHRGYFGSDARLLKQYRNAKTREFWLFGQGFADCFFKHPDNAADLAGRVKVLGDVIRAGEPPIAGPAQDDERDLVVFSLQLTADLSREEMAGSIAAMEKFFSDFFAAFGNKYKCRVKHHPRFGGTCDLGPFFRKFPQVKETREPWPALYPRMALHATFSSTVTFDCASAGIPTRLVDMENAKILDASIFATDYAYPLYGKTSQEILGAPPGEIRECVTRWFEKFYTPFEPERFISLLEDGVPPHGRKVAT